MGGCSTKSLPQQNTDKFIGTNAQFANLQKELVRLYRKVTNNDLVQSRLGSEQGVLDILSRLEKIVFGVESQGQNLIDRTERLSNKVDSATKFIVSVSNLAPIAGDTITVTAQLADAYDEDVDTDGIIVTWSSTTTNNPGTFGSLTSSTNESGVASVTFTVDSIFSTTYTVSGVAGTISGTSVGFTTLPPL